MAAKATGINRKIDELGRIVLPIELRRNLNLNEGDSLSILTEGENIILTKFIPRDEVREETVFELKALIKHGNLDSDTIETLNKAIEQLKG